MHNVNNIVYILLVVLLVVVLLSAFGVVKFAISGWIGAVLVVLLIVFLVRGRV
jgi:hypothetical protein